MADKMNRAAAQQNLFVDLFVDCRELVYCSRCRAPASISKRRERTRAAILECGHIAIYESDTGTWDVI